MPDTSPVPRSPNTPFVPQGRATRHLLPALLLLLLTGCRHDGTDITATIPPPNLGQIDLINTTYGQLIHETWSVHRVEGYKLGHRWTRVFRQETRDQDILHTLVIDDLLIPRFNSTSHQILRSATRSFEHGPLLQMEYEVHSQGQRRRLTGQVANGRLHLQHVIDGRRRTSDVPWSDSDGGFFALERSLADHPLSPGQSRDVVAWLPLVDRLQTYRLTAIDWEEILINDVTMRLLRIDVTAATDPTTSPHPSSRHPSSATRHPPSLIFWADADGHIQRRWRRILDQTTEVASQQAAMAPNESLKFDVALDVRIPLSSDWPDAESTRDARFRVALSDGNPAQLLAQSAYQQVTSIDATTATVHVVTTLPPPAKFVASETPPTASDVRPNAWLESNHPTIQEFAKSDDVPPMSKQEIALELRNRVAEALRQEALGGSLTTAAGALKQRAGDCTEHAMLLAAACRARQVPARVAVGLIYVAENQAFVYHMWTEIWTGRFWRPLDATRQSPVPAADRIKLGNTDLSEDSDYAIIAPVLQVIGQMKVQRIPAGR